MKALTLLDITLILFTFCARFLQPIHAKIKLRIYMFVIDKVN